MFQSERLVTSWYQLWQAAVVTNLVVLVNLRSIELAHMLPQSVVSRALYSDRLGQTKTLRQRALSASQLFL